MASSANRNIESIVSVRRAAGGSSKEYLVKWEGQTGDNMFGWLPEHRLAHCAEILKMFKRKRGLGIAEVLSQQEALALHSSKRRRRGSAAPPPDSKQRHMSASSVEVTPVYQEDAPPEEDGHVTPLDGNNNRTRRRSRKQQQSQLEKQLKVRRRHKEKLHTSCKDIIAASLQQRQSADLQPRSDGPSERMATRKSEFLHQHQHSQDQVTLSQVLSQPVQPLDSVADALHSCSADARATQTDEPLTISTLSRMLRSRHPDGNRGDPGRLAAALNQDGGSCQLDDSLPEAADPRLQHRLGRRLVHLAATAGIHAEKLLLHLLAAGAKPDVTDANSRTPLMLAAAEGDARAVERLLQFGARPDLLDKHKFTAVRLAAMGKHWEAVCVLLRWGAEFTSLSLVPGCDAAQLKPWTDVLSHALLRPLTRLRDSRIPRFSASLRGAQPPQLVALNPGGLRALNFPTQKCPARSQHLLVVALVELDGIGGVQLRRVPGGDAIFAAVMLNLEFLNPLISVDGFAVYPLPAERMSPVGQENKVRLGLSGQLPGRNRLKLVAQVVCTATMPPG